VKRREEKRREEKRREEKRREEKRREGGWCEMAVSAGDSAILLVVTI
jgi:hypothetical protein